MGKGDNNGGFVTFANGVATHPYAFHVLGPKINSSSSWTDVFSSSWRDSNFKRTVTACFVQAAYLLEEDRQAKRTGEYALAPKWWLPYNYKLVKTLIDEGDGSIFGAIFEWAGFSILRPTDAPAVILAIRGTMLNSANFLRDMTDNTRLFIFPSKSLSGSVRFTTAFNALQSLVENHGSANVCVAGHSLGAGLGLQIGKTFSENGIFVETHLLNPPWVTLPMHDRILLCTRLVLQIKAMVGGRSNEAAGGTKWVPHLYVNPADKICNKFADLGRRGPIGDGFTVDMSAKLYIVVAETCQKRGDAHSLAQWWNDGMNLKLVKWS